MLTLHPRILEKNGKEEFAVLPYEEFEQITTALADYEDLRDLRAAEQDEKDTPGIPLEQTRRELGI
uniref:Antitoxin Phd_YefM, type II toxin-antitoxin system n=1 Tax=Candidatus Kentrum sp. LPFa TaxID=2126335 RepID=A0A450W0Q1_9GAMM|nr:MAG: Antitoxin Phd_YefM, type II toxin-antitoxin system [Candidatus Kentron sp. LPFa]VFK26731.1 MAG: Antitoxin Phd_YefM, type II toxin-antitoxin system [Candidatus Kentron sp. LPFa]